MTYEERKAVQRLEYRMRRKAGLCAHTGCKRKAEKNGRKRMCRCREHLEMVNEQVRKHVVKAGRIKRTRAEWLIGLRAEREARAAAEKKTRRAAGGKETFCSCGLRAHGECDMPARRIEIRTAGPGARG